MGQDLYGAGHALGVEAVKRFGLKRGDRAMVWGLLSQPRARRADQGRYRRAEGSRLTVDYIEIDSATNKDPAAGVPTFAGYVPLTPTSSSSSPITAA